MSLIIEGGRVPARWAEKMSTRSMLSIGSCTRRTQSIKLALINNMPDPALEDTELQFFELLDMASGHVPIFIKLYSLTGIPRTDRGERHLNSFYCEFKDIWNSRFDGIIITGTEPREPNLQDEPYWKLLTDVFEWAGENTNSTVLSCLAAHASVLHCDGINRHRLPDKNFGVFESTKRGDHALTNDMSLVVQFPHSRWNEVRAYELGACGYRVLADSSAGVDLFVKHRKRSLFVHFQGHPEYGAQTLFKEYRRDIKRFLKGERSTYPSMPAGYFDQHAVQRLNHFRQKAIPDPREEMLESFPEDLVNGLQNTWNAAAACIYRNWLEYLASQRAKGAVFTAMASSSSQSQTKLRASS